MYDVLSIGEALMDFIPVPPAPVEQEAEEEWAEFSDWELDETETVPEAAEQAEEAPAQEPVPVFEQNVGGSPANVACALARLGVKTGFIGKVGNDTAGRTVKTVLDDCGVDTRNMILADGLTTPLAFVHRTEEGKQFTFYRNAGTADTHLEEDDIDDEIFTDCKVFNFSSFPLSAEPSRSTILNAVVKAKESGARITFDPNLRLNIWESPEQAREVILQALTLADILKISEEDFQFLFPGMDERAACEQIYLENGTEMIIITKADRGCYAYVNQDSYLSSAYDVPVVDTTGSGDAFLAGVIYNLMRLNKNVHDMSSVEITVMLDFANAVGSLVCTRPGAIAAFPTPREIVLCMEKIPKKMAENSTMAIWE